jgi:hypothetical protein
MNTFQRYVTYSTREGTESRLAATLRSATSFLQTRKDAICVRFRIELPSEYLEFVHLNGLPL